MLKTRLLSGLKMTENGLREELEVLEAVKSSVMEKEGEIECLLTAFKKLCEKQNLSGDFYLHKLNDETQGKFFKVVNEITDMIFKDIGLRFKPIVHMVWENVAYELLYRVRKNVN